MRILFDPIIRNYSGSITATNASINYNPNNIKHPFLKKRIQGSTTSQVITIPFDEDQSADCFFYGVHNLSALSAVFKDSGGSTIDTVVVSSIYDIGVEYFTQIDGIRSIELTITTASTYVKLGGFEAGIFYQMPDFKNSWPKRIIDNSLAEESNGGQMTTDDITKRRAYVFDLVEITAAVSDEIITNYNLNGKRPVYIDITEGDRTVFAPIYARIEKPLSQEKNNRRFSTQVEVMEAF